MKLWVVVYPSGEVTEIILLWADVGVTPILEDIGWEAEGAKMLIRDWQGELGGEGSWEENRISSK